MVSLNFKESPTPLQSQNKEKLNENFFFFWVISGHSWSFLIEKEPDFPVATEKDVAQSNNSLFYFFILIGLLGLILFSLTQIPKMVSAFQKIILEKPQPTWIGE